MTFGKVPRYLGPQRATFSNELRRIDFQRTLVVIMKIALKEALFFRKDLALKSHYKISSEEIYLKHPHDLIQSLKGDRQLLRKKQSIQLTKVRNAIEV